MSDNEEPMPIQNSESRSVQSEAIKRFTDVFMSQWEKGKAKYGTDLMTFNGRDAGNDALQEACDLVAYIVQMAMESSVKDATIAALRAQVADLQVQLAQRNEDAEEGGAVREATQTRGSDILISYNLYGDYSVETTSWNERLHCNNEAIAADGNTRIDALRAAGLLKEEAQG